MRFWGNNSAAASRRSSESNGVSVTDGATAFDRTPSSVYPFASDRVKPATAAFEETESESDSGTGARVKTDGGAQPASESWSGDDFRSDTVSMERAEGEACGDEVPEVPPR